MKKSKRKTVTKQKHSSPKPVDTTELCKELVAMAAFIENLHVREKIYKAVRQLQILDKVATDAGLLP